jgi:hypothetical protein
VYDHAGNNNNKIITSKQKGKGVFCYQIVQSKKVYLTSNCHLLPIRMVLAFPIAGALFVESKSR